MEDYIIREIDKIGQLIQALLHKAGIIKESGQRNQAVESTKVELADKLNIDIETLLCNDNFVEILTHEYGFNSDNLESFAELLADLAAAADSPQEQIHLATAVCTIYKYQDAHKAPVSMNRYYILKELEKYRQQ